MEYGGQEKPVSRVGGDRCGALVCIFRMIPFDCFHNRGCSICPPRFSSPSASARGVSSSTLFKFHISLDISMIQIPPAAAPYEAARSATLCSALLIRVCALIRVEKLATNTSRVPLFTGMPQWVTSPLKSMAVPAS